MWVKNRFAYDRPRGTENEWKQYGERIQGYEGSAIEEEKMVWLNLAHSWHEYAKVSLPTFTLWL
jgi:hypothetical protein